MDSPPIINPPSGVTATVSSKSELFPPIVFCHSINPNSSVLISQKSFVKGCATSQLGSVLSPVAVDWE